jgi:mannosyltransferase
MTNAIGRYMADPDAALAAGRRALDHVRANFALEKEARAIGEVYRQLLS